MNTTPKMPHIINRNIIGKKFGFLTILGYEPERNSFAKWKLQCECGNICYSRMDNLKNGNKKTCGSAKCQYHKSSVRNATRLSKEKTDGFHDSIIELLNNPSVNMKNPIICLSNTKWLRIINSAASRNLEFSISKHYAEWQYTKQNGLCNITKIPLNDKIASIDRIDSSIGYVEGNIQWVHAIVNSLKLDFNQDYFIHLCQKIAHFQQNKATFVLPTYIPYKPKNSTTYKGEICHSFWNRRIKNAKRRKIDSPPDFTISDAESLYLEQAGICALSGLTIRLRPKNNFTASLDRKDSTKGYTKDNVQWVHKHVNILKSSLNIDTLIDFCRLIYKNFPDIDNSKDFNVSVCRKPKNYTHFLKKTTKDFTQKAKSLKEDKFDYSKVDYTNRYSEIEIVCKTCNNSFLVKPYAFLLSKVEPCPSCRIEKSKIHRLFWKKEYWSKLSPKDKLKYYGRIEKRTENLKKWKENAKNKYRAKSEKEKPLRAKRKLDRFIVASKVKYGDQYDYSQAIYNGCKAKIQIICNKCKTPFKQSIYNHLDGTIPCPTCCKEIYQNKKTIP